RAERLGERCVGRVDEGQVRTKALALVVFFFQAEDGIRDLTVTGVQTCALPILTMSSADYLEEWFEFEPLKATKSASGIIGTFMGPRSPGSAYVLLHHYMGEIDGAFRAWGFCKGGNGTISQAIARAALEKGAEIRTEAPVR